MAAVALSGAVSESVDTFSTMDEFDIIQLRRNPDWKAVLQVYYDLQQQAREKEPSAECWIGRQIEVTGVEPVNLSAIHGKLIAFGFLKFDVGGRDVGVQYQMTHQGRRALLGETASADDDADFAESA
ncbi:MAG: hypothetical protein WCJ09_00890 [Planctomycetota bacterium]